YPEGTEGNCKPFWHAYRMRRWRTGFVHLAAALDAPIVPVAILGAEESLPVACTLRALQPFVGTVLPVPLSVLPLPARWKIVFHAPEMFHAERGADAEDDPKQAPRRARRVADAVRSIVQCTLDREAEHRLLGRLSRRFQRERGGRGADELAATGAEPQTPRRPVIFP